MSDLDAVLERLITDPAFAHELSRNPTEALARYELTGDDLATLSTQVSFDRGAGGHVEERISKSSTFGLLSSMAGGLSGLGGDATGLGGPDTTPAMVGVENPTTIGDPNLAPGVIDPNQAPGGEHGYGFAVDAFNPSEVEEGPEERGGADIAPAGIIILDQPDPGIVDPNQVPGVIDPNQAPGGEDGYGLAVDAFTPSDVEEGPEERGGADTAPAGIIILDQPDPGIGNPNEAPSIGDPNQAPR